MGSYSYYYSRTDYGRLANLVRLSSSDVNAPAQGKNCLHQPQHKCLDRVGAPQRLESEGRRAEENLNERR